MNLIMLDQTIYLSINIGSYYKKILKNKYGFATMIQVYSF